MTGNDKTCAKESIVRRPREQAVAYSPRHAAEAVDVSPQRIYDAINAGDLPARKFGRRTLVLHDDLMTWLENLPAYAMAAAHA